MLRGRAAWDDDAVASVDVYGFHASRVRALRREKEGPKLEVEAAPRKRRSPPSWAWLISKVYEAAPASCLFGESWAVWARARRSMKGRRSRRRSGAALARRRVGAKRVLVYRCLRGYR